MAAMIDQIPHFSDRHVEGDLTESPLGAWVRYADHAAALEKHMYATTATLERVDDQIDALKGAARDAHAALNAAGFGGSIPLADRIQLLALERNAYRMRLKELEGAAPAEKHTCAESAQRIDDLHAYRVECQLAHAALDAIAIENSGIDLERRIGKTGKALESEQLRIAHAEGVLLAAVGATRPDGAATDLETLVALVPREIARLRRERDFTLDQAKEITDDQDRLKLNLATARAERDQARAAHRRLDGYREVGEKLAGRDAREALRALARKFAVVVGAEYGCEGERPIHAVEAADRVLQRLAASEEERNALRAGLGQVAERLGGAPTAGIKEILQHLDYALYASKVFQERAREAKHEVATLTRRLAHAEAIRAEVQAEASRLRVALAQVAARHGFDAGASIEQVLHAVDYRERAMSGRDRALEGALADLAMALQALAHAEAAQVEAQREAHHWADAARLAQWDGREAMLRECVAALRKRAKDLRNGEPSYDMRAEFVESDAAYLKNKVQP